MAAEEQIQATARVIHDDCYDLDESPCRQPARKGKPLECRCVNLASEALEAAERAHSGNEEMMQEQYRKGVQDSLNAIKRWIKVGPLQGAAHSQRNGMVLASNEVYKLLDAAD